jgi:hypothetical protein
MGITFWIGAAIVPLVLLVGNAVIRGGLGMAQSAGADAGLAFVAFDVAVLIQADDFKKYVRYSEFAANMIAIFVLVLVVCFISWVLLVIAERAIDKFRENRQGGFPFLAFLGSYFLPAFMVFLNVSPFIYGR